ncbi:MAG: glutamate ligase domain-containing protein, partial [Luminiphilus sp.]
QTLPDGRRLVDDCYNANPMAVRAALDVLANESGRRRLVLGAMLELGRESDQLHREIGAYAAAKDIEEFWVVGPVTAPAAEAFGPGAEYFESVAQLMTRYPSFQGADIAVIKASRGARLERIVERWRSAGEVPC